MDDLPGIWILASNDKNNIITFEGVKYRLGLSEECNIREYIEKRGDLFRVGAPALELESWKNRMRDGKDLPSYIRSKKTQEERNSAIEAITKDKVFRSQFRITEQAPVSNMEQIEWGLTYIERLRSAAMEREKRRLAFFKELVFPGIAVLASLLSISVLYCSILEQRKNTELQVKFIAEDQAYGAFCSALDDSLEALVKEHPYHNDDLGSYEEKFDTTYYCIVPFLSEGQRTIFEKKKQDYRSSILDPIDGVFQKNTRGKPLVTSDIYDEVFPRANPKLRDMKQYLMDSLFPDQQPDIWQRFLKRLHSWCRAQPSPPATVTGTGS